jgi:hypothetical protein
VAVGGRGVTKAAQVGQTAVVQAACAAAGTTVSTTNSRSVGSGRGCSVGDDMAVSEQPLNNRLMTSTVIFRIMVTLPISNRDLHGF